MIVNEVEERMIHRLPLPKRRVHPEMGRCIGQPACTGPLSLYRIGPEEAMHCMLISMHSRTRMHSIMRPRLLAPVPAVFFILLGHCVLVPTVLLIFLWRLFLFAAGRGMMLMVMARRRLGGLVIGLLKLF